MFSVWHSDHTACFSTILTGFGSCAFTYYLSTRVVRYADRVDFSFLYCNFRLWCNYHSDSKVAMQQFAQSLSNGTFNILMVKMMTAMIIIPWPHRATQSIFAICPTSNVKWIVTTTHFTSHLHTKTTILYQLGQQRAYHSLISYGIVATNIRQTVKNGHSLPTAIIWPLPIVLLGLNQEFSIEDCSSSWLYYY